MISLCILSLVLLYVCYRYKKLYAEDEKTLGYIFASHAFDFLLPLSIVLAFYAVFALYMNESYAGPQTLERLRGYEKSVAWLKETFGYFKLSSGYSFLLLVALFLISFFIRLAKASASAPEWLEKGYSYYGKYSKWHKRIAIFLALLASFTFLGGQVYDHTDSLEARIKHLEEKYDGYRKQLKEAVENAVVSQIHAKLSDSVSPTFRKFRDVDNKFDERYKQTLRKYDNAKESYKVESPKINELRDRIARRSVETVSKLNEAAQSTTESEAPVPALHPELVTEDLLNNLEEKTGKYSAATKKFVEPLLANSLGKRITPAAIKLIIDHKNSAALSALTAEIPILESLLGALTDTVNKKLGNEINDLSDRMLEKSITNPEIDLLAVTTPEVDKIVESSGIDWNAGRMAGFQIEHEAVARQAVDLEAGTAEMNSLLSKRRAEMQIENRDLIAKLRADWNRAARAHAQEPLDPNSIPARLGYKKPSLRESQAAIDKFIGGVSSLEPYEANTALQSAAASAESSSDFGSKLSELSRLAETNFPDTSVARSLALLDSSTSPKSPSFTVPKDFGQDLYRNLPAARFRPPSRGSYSDHSRPSYRPGGRVGRR